MGLIKTAKDKEEAKKFLFSARGCYIVSQALFVAINQMKKVPKIKREESNIKDMEYLMDTLFPLYKILNEAEQELKKKGYLRGD